MIDGVDHVVSNRVQQLVEHRRGFDLVLDQGVALPVGAQADALAQVVDRGQVLDPELIDDVEHPLPFEQPHRSAPNCCSRAS